MAMIAHDSRAVVEAYARSHDPQFFAPDAQLVQMPLPEQPLTGREAIGALLRLFYYEAFSDAGAEYRTVAVDTEKGVGVLEFTFRGRHTGELLGIPPTYRPVEVPMLAVYDLRDGEIQQGRLYYDLATLLRQLGQQA